MKLTINKPTEITITAIHVRLPVRYGEEDIPNDFPLRTGDVWEATIDVDTGSVHGWPKGQFGNLYMKVCDEGSYRLLCGNIVVATRREDYVPHSFIPGDSGDYVDLQINDQGIVTNWKNRMTSEDLEGWKLV